MDELLKRVSERIRAGGLSAKTAATQIGVSPATLERHLNGGYVRSDSLARYRAWLDDRPRAGPRTAAPETAPVPRSDPNGDLVQQRPGPTTRRRQRPFQVVDLFSGCGGMSLGFELFAEDGAEATLEGVPRTGPRGGVFRTVLALDIEDKVVGLHNHNHPSSPIGPARWVDLADFRNEAEVLAFYLDHRARTDEGPGLRQALGALPGVSLGRFQAMIQGLDARFLEALRQVRSTPAYRRAYAEVEATVFGQTCVIGFHDALGLPQPGTGPPALGPLVWAHPADPGATRAALDFEGLPGFARARAAATRQWHDAWEAATARLRARVSGQGRGQLASSADRVRRFLEFLASPALGEVRKVWLQWRAEREALREVVFTEPVEQAMRELYQDERQVDVLLGGPPCQGFSRIGRGKIRSLRDHAVHVESDAEAGDARNRLLWKYVLFVSALAPRAFLFENVRHFQARVQTPEGTFLASEVLREAIQGLSRDRLDYRITDRIVDCSRHGVPQTRERFVMAGVRADVRAPGIVPDRLPAWCLALPEAAPVPLRAALHGLPAPLLVLGKGAGGERGLTARVTLPTGGAPEGGAAAQYFDWVRQPAPGEALAAPPTTTDAHVIRAPRRDDRDLFELIGPGRRWMDYRCDTSATLAELRDLVAQVRQALAAPGKKRAGEEAWAATIDRELLETVAGKLDGALTIRLLLERIPPLDGELQHHLLAPNYLAKREGNNGDWIARLHPDRPCKTIVSHMGKDTYAYVHPSAPRTLSVREAARVQTFPDWFSFAPLGLVDAFRAIGNAVPPLLSHQFAGRLAELLRADDAERAGETAVTAARSEV